MFIATEPTPNPSTLKFLPGIELHGGEAVEFTDLDVALERSPLAAALLSMGDVERVLIGQDFVSVTVAPGGADWSALKPEVLGVLADQLAAGAPAMVSGEDDDLADDPADADIVAQIRELLDTRVRPAVAGDGGDIVYRGFHEGVVSLRMKGACSGCPSSTATLKHGIENLLRYYVPEVTEVRAV
jgi:Fe-S cluster biogenesis protein NfuA